MFQIFLEENYRTPWHAQGNTHCAKFESNINRMTFEYAPNMMTVKVHPQDTKVPSYIFELIHFPFFAYCAWPKIM